MTALTTTRTLDADKRARGTDLGAFAALLQEQKVNTVDLVVPASKLQMEDGALHIRRHHHEAELTLDGVTPAGDRVSRYTPAKMADEGLSTRLNIPRDYLDRIHNGGTIARKTVGANLPLYDSSVNLSLAHQDGDPKYLVRILQGRVEEYGTDGYVRAFLTNGYRIIDNLDVLLSTLDGIRAAGINPNALKIECDLTERRMYVRVHAPEVAVAAHDLLKNYRSPYGGGLDASQQPLIYAGFTITNSETGHGKAAITPQTIVQVCRNGMTWKSDAMAEVHLGKRLDEGVITWSDATQAALLNLIKEQAKDAVKTFLSKTYVQRKVDEMAQAASVSIDRDAREDAVQVVQRECAFTKDEGSAILADFLGNGNSSVGGIVQAVTSAAQRFESPDTQWKLEGSTEKVLALAPKLARI